MTTVNEDLFDKLVRHQIGLTRLGSQTASDLVDRLNTYDKEIVAIINRLDAHTSKTALNKALREIRKVNIKAYLRIEKDMKKALEELAIKEATYQTKALKEVTPAQAFKQMKPKLPTNKALKRMVIEQPVNGALLTEHINGMEMGRFTRIRDLLRREITTGGTDAAVSQAIRQGIVGSSATGYQDGLLGLSRRSLEQKTKTLNNGIAQASRSEFVATNDDIFDGEQWVSMLETNTCEQCASLDGTVFPVGEGPRPTLHPNCRCEMVPVVKDWEAMGLEDLGPGTRESMDGEVPETTTYNQWLRGQPASVQDEALGPTRGKLFRDNEITVDRFVDDNGRRITLDELEAQGLF